MKKIYFLKTCDTCAKILKSIDTKEFDLREIKTNTITVAEIEEMKYLSGSYEALFSRRAKKYSQMDLKNQMLSEEDYKQLILDEYTFLKRPVIINENDIYIGNSKKNIEKLITNFSK